MLLTRKPMTMMLMIWASTKINILKFSISVIFVRLRPYVTAYKPYLTKFIFRKKEESLKVSKYNGKSGNILPKVQYKKFYP